MVSCGEEKVKVHMNVVLRSTKNSLQNRRNFLRISGKQRRKRGEREARVASEGRIAGNLTR